MYNFNYAFTWERIGEHDFDKEGIDPRICLDWISSWQKGESEGCFHLKNRQFILLDVNYYLLKWLTYQWLVWYFSNSSCRRIYHRRKWQERWKNFEFPSLIQKSTNCKKFAFYFKSVHFFYFCFCFYFTHVFSLFTEHKICESLATFLNKEK